MQFNKKVIIGAVAALVLAIVGLNSYKVVQDGSVATKTFMGKVSPTVLNSGLHFPVNPLASFDTFSTRDIKISFDRVQVPSQDKFKSAVDITVMLKFDGNKAPQVRINGGTQDIAIDKYVTQKLMSTVREYGKSVKVAQDLFKPDVQAGLQSAIMNEVNEYSQPYGFTITEVFLQDIDLDEAIMKQVKATKIREEAVNQAQADLDREAKIAQKAVKTAEANREAAEQQAIASERAAQAEAFAARTQADAKLYAAEKEAEGNRKLQTSLTPEVLRKIELENQQILYSRYGGGTPSTVTIMGGDGKVNPNLWLNGK